MQERMRHLFLLGSSTTSALSSLDASLVTLRLARSHSHHTASGLPWSLELTDRRPAKDVHLDQIALEGAFDRDDGLDQKWVGVFEIEMHETHHSNTHQLALVCRRQLILVVLLDRRGDELGFLTGSHRRRFDVFQRGQI